MIPPYRVCMSGGGIKGLAHIGALEVLHERGLLVAVKEYIGISAGALCALCLCVGCTLSELRMIAELLDFGTLRALDPETMLRFPEDYGLDTGENLLRFLGAILRAKNLPADITFAGLAARGCGPALRVYATDLASCQVLELSARASPTMEVRQGLFASMCIPFYFRPVRHPETGHLLVDGGVVCHSPMKFLAPEERDTALSITFSDEHKPVEEITNFYEFLRQLYYALDYQYNEELTSSFQDRVVFLRCGRINTLNFEMGAEEKMSLIQAGREGAESFLRERPWRRPQAPRRYSVG